MEAAPTHGDPRAALLDEVVAAVSKLSTIAPLDAAELMRVDNAVICSFDILCTYVLLYAHLRVWSGQQDRQAKGATACEFCLSTVDPCPGHPCPAKTRRCRLNSAR